MMVTNVTSLLKTVKSVEDEHTRGTRALESTIEAIAQEIRSFDGPEPPRSPAGPEDLMRATRPITIATAKAVAAGKSCKQDDVIVAANMGRKAISDMLATCKVRKLPGLTTHCYSPLFYRPRLTEPRLTTYGCNLSRPDTTLEFSSASFSNL